MHERTWPEGQLGGLLRERPKNGYSPVESSVPTDTLMLGLGCLMSDGFVPRQLKFAPAGDPTVKSVLLADGDVLVSRSNTRELVGLAGRYRDVGRPCSYPDLMMRLRPTSRLDSRFLELVLLNSRARRWFQANASGTSGSMVKITADVVCATPVPLVPLSEQVRIAAVLDTVDDAVRGTERVIAKLEQIKRGLLHDLLTHGIDDNGEIRDPERHPQQFKDSLLGRIPKEWSVARLGELLSDGPQNGVYKGAGDIGAGALMVGQVAFSANDRVDFSKARRGRLTAPELRVYGLRQDDLLVTRVFATVAGVGRSVLVDDPPEPAVYESNMMRLRVDLQRVRPAWVFRWMKQEPARKHIYAVANASNQTSINQMGLNSLPCPSPAVAEQDRALAILEEFERHEHAQGDALVKLRLLKKGLMDDLLTGRVRVPAMSGAP